MSYRAYSSGQLGNGDFRSGCDVFLVSHSSRSYRSSMDGAELCCRILCERRINEQHKLTRDVVLNLPQKLRLKKEEDDKGQPSST
jgi:hypothetical protein